ncbi:MAG: zf-HC2 domain-containing protein [Deltaproteobacteria bacterium]
MNKPFEQYTCPQENLILFFYGELNATERLQMEGHLQGCAACRKELEQLRTFLEILPKKQLEISRGEILSFNEKVSRRLRAKPKRHFRPVIGWSLATAAIAALLLLTLRPPIPEQNQSGPAMSVQMVNDFNKMPETEMLLNLDLLQNMDMLLELEKTGVRG